MDTKWWRLSVEESFKTGETGSAGLSDNEAESRLKRDGPNILTPPPPPSALKLFLSQFSNALIIVLLVATVLIFVVWAVQRDPADLIEGFLVLAIVLLITILGFVQEYKAERAIQALKKMMALKAKVRRQGEVKEVAASELVTGDLVLLEEGSRVPADLRLIEIAELTLDEASLTGESVPVRKVTEALEKDVAVAERQNMAFSGTVVAAGRGIGIVVGTGNTTEIGAIAKSVAETEDEPTPIQKRLGTVGKLLGYSVLVIAVLVFVFIVFLAEDFKHLPTFERVINSFVGAVALAVAAIPEGLPAVVTISLALGAQRMLKRRSLIRKLSSVETLGSTDVICADKTGTLTKGEMTVRQLWLNNNVVDLSGTGYEKTGQFTYQGKSYNDPDLKRLLAIGAECNNASLSTEDQWLGDPTEVALKVSALKGEIKQSLVRRQETPFSSERKMMSVIVEDDKQLLMYSKGAPEIILAQCQKILLNGKLQPLSLTQKEKILEVAMHFSTQALRTLAFAYKEVKSLKTDEQGLIFVGLQGLIDPPRSEIKPLIEQCRQAGIRTIMITGDHLETAKAVSREIGLVGEATNGSELDSLSEEEFQEKARTINIFARVSPGFKMRIVQALKKQGHIVAMTGDGVNDAPALKAANIGIAMGITGTDVAKEASDMVLLDDRFETIFHSIEEGRGIYDNLKKFVNYLLSCNISEVLIVFFAIIFFQELPLTAVMLLWINIVTDGLPALALGIDPAERGIMKHPPKEFQAEIVTGRSWVEMLIFGTIVTIGILVLFSLNLDQGLEKARAVVFSALVVFEMLRLLIVRGWYRVGVFSNPWLIGAIALSLALQLLLLYTPAVAKVFGLAPLTLTDWLIITLFSVLVWLLMKVFTFLLSPRHRAA